MRPTADIDFSKRPLRVLFVCLGNICRSPAAEEVLRVMARGRKLDSRLTIDSAGLYGGHAGDLPDSRMRAHARRRDYSLTHRSRQVRPSDFDSFDIIVDMDDSNVSRLRAMAPTLDDEAKVVAMASFFRQHPYSDCVPDPYYEGAEGFEKALDLIEDGCATILDLMEGKA